MIRPGKPWIVKRLAKKHSAIIFHQTDPKFEIGIGFLGCPEALT
jgi:hypothetical protein